MAQPAASQEGHSASHSLSTPALALRIFSLSLHFFHVSLFCHTRIKPALQTSRFPWLSAAEDTPACLRSAPSYTGHVAEQMLEADRPKAGSQTAQNLDENLHLVVVWVLVEALLTTSPGRAALSPRVLVP